MHRRSLVVVPLLALSVLVPGLGSPAVAEEGTHSPNMTHVANLDYPKAGDPDDGGTDIEFVTLPVQVGEAEDGSPIVEDRDFALAGSYSNGLQIVDITDPTKPQIASTYDCEIRQGDV